MKEDFSNILTVNLHRGCLKTEVTNLALAIADRVQT
jgi:hypothetical protein